MQARDTRASPRCPSPPVPEVAGVMPENEEPQEAQVTATCVRARCGWLSRWEGRDAGWHQPAAPGAERMGLGVGDVSPPVFLTTHLRGSSWRGPGHASVLSLGFPRGAWIFRADTQHSRMLCRMSLSPGPITRQRWPHAERAEGRVGGSSHEHFLFLFLIVLRSFPLYV